MRRRSTLLLALVLCIGAACSTVAVNPKPGQPSATLNFLADPSTGGNSTQSLYARTNRNCGADLGLTTLGTHGMFWGNSNGPRPLTAGAPLTLMADTTYNVTMAPGYQLPQFAGCRSMGILTPKAGHNYQVVHIGHDIRDCRLQVIDTDTGQQPPEYQALPNC